jgi:glucose-6-phosphate 1-dehydrogenase
MSQSVATQDRAKENPLLEGMQHDKRADPFAMVIVGAHGDLTKRKLLPALYALYLQDLLPKDFAIVGLSRTAMSDDAFRKFMAESLQKFAPDLKFEQETWDRFAKSLYYLPADVSKKQDLDNLKNKLDELKDKHGTQGNHIFYLSTAPSLYSTTVKGLAASGLTKKCRANEAPWPRMIVEKPFGHDLESSEELDYELHEVLNEHQIYRIDHYLGKETVQNIMVLRFANGIFEPLWNYKYIDHVQITNAETLGVEDRGPYYEEAGALRDMFQNHLLQLVSLVGMEPPISMGAEATRDEKAKLLKCLRPIEKEHVNDFVVRGQYGPGYILGQDVPGYRQENRVSPQSDIETFVALKLHIDNWRWAGVPFFVRSGKRLAKSITEIAIQFSRPPQRLFKDVPGIGSEGISPNVLVIQVQPDEGISLKFATKQPGQTNTIRYLNMDFKYGTAFGVRSPSAYERLIHDCMLGDPSLFSRTDQVDVAWKFVDPIMASWAEQNKNNPPKFSNYSSGSWGPEASDQLISSAGFSWRRL